MKPTRDDDNALVERILDVIADLSLHEAGAALGVSHQSVARWRGGERALQPGTRRKLRQFLRDQEGRERPLSEALDMFSDQVALIRHFEGVAPPGEKRLLKLDAWEGYRRFLSARGPVPEWFMELRERIERGEI